MANKPPPGKPKPIRWTINQASMEFGVERKTLTSKLRGLEAQPADDGRYSTLQIDAAIHGDSDAEKLRLLQEQFRKLKLENDRKSGEQVDKEMVFKAYEGVFICLRQTILGSNMTDAEKAECLAQLRHDTMEAKPIE